MALAIDSLVPEVSRTMNPFRHPHQTRSFATSIQQPEVIYRLSLSNSQAQIPFPPSQPPAISHLAVAEAVVVVRSQTVD
jgi:hypothetical protein